MTNSFSHKIRNHHKTILYELLPPPKNLSEADLNRSLSSFVAMLKSFPIDAVNIPEVKEETRSGERDSAKIEKSEPRKICRYLQKYGINELIINRPIVYLPWEDQKKWLEETYNEYGIQNYIFVGGESHTVNYPGLSVTEAVKTITQQYGNKFPSILIGGITIPHRKNEAERVLKKSLAGVEFFTSQIIYESENINHFLKKYWELCQKNQIRPKTIILSFAPITMVRDINLLLWLGVQIPQETQDFLKTGWLGMGWRSQQICQNILEKILDFMDKNKIKIPLGLNIEHVNQHNFETSFDLLNRLSGIFLKS